MYNNEHTAKCPYGELSYGEMSYGEKSYGENPGTYRCMYHRWYIFDYFNSFENTWIMIFTEGYEYLGLESIVENVTLHW